ncbi:O-antigen ligase family protein [Listeria aquatica]|uniref:O-antigen ligase family protein n=1 Tax=Listeria aquatica TaxID=1494960 RepID=UPI0031F5266D
MTKNKPLNIYFFFIIMSVFPLVDFLNGLFISFNVPLPLGTAYRFFCFIYLVVCILHAGLKKNFYTLISITFIAGSLMLLFLQAIVLQNSVSFLFADLAVFTKFFLWVVIAYFVYQRKEIFLTMNYSKIFLVVSILFTLEMLIPYFLNVGNQAYVNSNAGYKSFFFASNDLTIAFMINATFVGWHFIKALERKAVLQTVALLILYLGIIVTLILISTKTGIIYGILFTVGILIHFLVCQKQFKSIYRLIIFIIAVAALIGLVVAGWDFIISATSGMVDRITYFYRLYNGNLVRLLTSSRSDYMVAGYELFADNRNNFLIPLIGFGFEYRSINFERYGLIEMDPVDGLYALGLIGVVLTTVMLGYFFFVSLKKQNRSIYTIAFMVLMFYSISAGHVMFSALSSTMLGLVCGGILLQKYKHSSTNEEEAVSKEVKQSEYINGWTKI